MSDDDRARWDRRYADRETVSNGDVALPAFLQPFVEILPTAGSAIDLACGRGGAAVWLAQRGLRVWGCDVSPVAVTQARALAEHCGVAARCRFEIVDLDDGLPAGASADLLICNRFRDSRLDQSILKRLSGGGLLAISALSEVGASPGPFRARAGELLQAFGGLDVIEAREANGEAWLVARARNG
ncbi:SAM-dependent methyltransferase [Mycolicibacterium cyprinidarum]|nr:SAM-dependent methyltransferase [Mycolicibacterium sp. NGTWS1803]